MSYFCSACSVHYSKVYMHKSSPQCKALVCESCLYEIDMSFKISKCNRCGTEYEKQNMVEMKANVPDDVIRKERDARRQEEQPIIKKYEIRSKSDTEPVQYVNEINSSYKYKTHKNKILVYAFIVMSIELAMIIVSSILLGIYLYMYISRMLKLDNTYNIAILTLTCVYAGVDVFVIIFSIFVVVYNGISFISHLTMVDYVKHMEPKKNIILNVVYSIILLVGVIVLNSLSIAYYINVINTYKNFNSVLHYLFSPLVQSAFYFLYIYMHVKSLKVQNKEVFKATSVVV